MTTKPVLGISGCLTGSAVRFDGGHKRMGFVMDELAQWVAFRPVCPEMAIGLPTPRPALRLVKLSPGCPSKKTVACTIRYCGKTLLSAFLLSTN